MYCHMPDTQTPVEEQAAALNEHFKKGHFAKVGNLIISTFAIFLAE